jgi:hypothetical protein
VSTANEKSERRDNEVGAPETGLTGISQILTPRLKTSNTGTWIDRHRSSWIIPFGDTSVKT